MAALTSILTLVCVIRMNELLRRDLILRRVTKAVSIISIFTIPLPVYELVMHMKNETDHLYGGKMVNNRSIPIYVEFGLIAFYVLLCANVFCAIQGAAEERVRPYLHVYKSFFKFLFSDITKARRNINR